MLQRFFKCRSATQLTLTNSSSTTPDIPMAEFAGGVIYIPAGSAITSLTFYGCERQTSMDDALTPAGNTQPALIFEQLYDSTNTAVSQTVAAGRCYALPAGCFAFGTLRIVIDQASAAAAISLKA